MPINLMSESWNQFAEKLRQNGYELLKAANPKLVVTEKGASDPNVITATLLCRSLTHLQAVSMLLKAGLVVEARTIVRNCLENAFWLAALAEPNERDETMRRMGDAEMFSRKQMGEFAMQLRSKHAAESNEALREVLHKMKGQKGSVGPTPKELARLGKFESTYLFYQVYSRDAHPTPHSLSRYLSRIVEHGEVIRCLDVLPLAREEDEFTLQHACQAVLSAMFAANDIWTAGEAVRLTELGEEYSALAGLDKAAEKA